MDPLAELRGYLLARGDDPASVARRLAPLAARERERQEVERLLARAADLATRARAALVTSRPPRASRWTAAPQRQARRPLRVIEPEAACKWASPDYIIVGGTPMLREAARRFGYEGHG